MLNLNGTHGNQHGNREREREEKGEKTCYKSTVTLHNNYYTRHIATCALSLSLSFSSLFSLSRAFSYFASCIFRTQPEQRNALKANVFSQKSRHLIKHVRLAMPTSCQHYMPLRSSRRPVE